MFMMTPGSYQARSGWLEDRSRLTNAKSGLLSEIQARWCEECSILSSRDLLATIDDGDWPAILRQNP
ncbi:hypothetical protein JCGZ_06574 [Jatropha curcas]|uniref:Uncharacterized protein n=1 Tax=Jatropha curcas TaxID=180498 RepID=A0A067LFM8_JATCU|nr:hypothetical protein JCGZ_06574 [Jatropha curcas]